MARRKRYKPEEPLRLSPKNPVGAGCPPSAPMSQIEGMEYGRMSGSW